MNIRPSRLKGTVRVPGSKSATHRALLCASLAEGTSIITNPVWCDDTKATADVCRSFGASIDGGQVRGISHPRPFTVDIGASGTTARLATGIAATIPGKSKLEGKALERPMDHLYAALRTLGVRVEGHVITGPMHGGKVSIRGDISSQYISSLLIAGAQKGIKITLTSSLASRAYVEMTKRIMYVFGVQTDGLHVPAQLFRSAVYEVPGDWSAAAFWYVAAAINGSLHIKGLQKDEQADRRIEPIVKAMGCSVDASHVKRSDLVGIDIDIDQCPDLAPILAVIATQAKGITRLHNAGRLRIKECDRALAIEQELGKMGACISVKDDTMSIHGPTILHAATIDPRSDHRIAMAAAIAGTLAKGITTINDDGCVAKSYPAFWDDLQSVGGRCT